MVIQLLSQKNGTCAFAAGNFQTPLTFEKEQVREWDSCLHYSVEDHSHSTVKPKKRRIFSHENSREWNGYLTYLAEDYSHSTVKNLKNGELPLTKY
jgi:hypothetical protein